MAVDEVGKVTSLPTRSEPSTQQSVETATPANQDPATGQSESGATRATLQKVVGQGVANPVFDLNPPGTSAVPISAPPSLVSVNPDGSAHLPVGDSLEHLVLYRGNPRW
jgi:hypothetical protein